MRLHSLSLACAAGLFPLSAWALQPSVNLIGANPTSLALAGVQNIDGTTIRIGQIEPGNPLSTHAALNGHVTIDNNPAMPGPFNDNHATSVAGVMVSQGAAPGNANEKGVAPGAQVYSYATQSNPGVPSSGLIIDGTQRLVADGIRIMNTSFGLGTGGNGNSRATLAVDYFVHNNNLLWTKSAGNEGGGGNPVGAQTITIPGDCYNCVTVGATGPSPTFNRVAAFSSEGRTADLRNKPDIVAPGTDINMPVTPSPNFAPGSGTSFAAPHVAGVAALLDQFASTAPQHPNGLDHRVTEAVLYNSASKDGGEKPGEVRVTQKDGTTLWRPTTPGLDPLDDQMGTGEVNARAAFVQFNRPEATTMSPAPGTSINFSVDPIAWDFNHVYGGQFDQYNINQMLQAGTKLTATVVWDRNVTRTACTAPCNPLTDDTFTASVLNNLNLDLYENGVLLHTFDAQGRASFSDSVIDSVEHIYFTLPDTAMYSLRVSDLSAGDELFGFAVWSHIPEPGTVGMLAVGLIGLIAARRRG